MARPPIDINKLASRAQGAARALNPPERQAAEAITRRATKGGPTISVTSTTGIVPKERTELSGGLSLETGSQTARDAWAGGNVTQSAYFNNAELFGKNSVGDETWRIQSNGAIVIKGGTPYQLLTLFESGGMIMKTAANIMTFRLNAITGQFSLYDTAGQPVVDFVPVSNNYRFAARPEVGPSGSTTPVALMTDLAGGGGLGTGQTPAVQSGEYLGPLHYVGGVITTQSYGGNNVVLFRIEVDRPITVNALAARVTTAATGNLRMGVYASNSNGMPTGAPLVTNAMALGGTVGTKLMTVTATQLDPGAYWIAFVCDVTLVLQAVAEGALQDGVYGMTASTVAGTFTRQGGRFFGQTYGALPTNPAAGSTLGSVAAVYVRIV